MPITVPFSGENYEIPSQAERNWAEDLNAFFEALAANSLPRSGGDFTLAADIDLGSVATVIAKAIAANGGNAAAAGFVRMAKSQAIAWRNEAGTGDVTMTINASDRVQASGKVLALLEELTALETYFATELSAKLDSNSGVAQGLQIDDFLEFDEEASPATPATGKGRISYGADKKFYQIDSSGVSKVLGGGGLEGKIQAATLDPAVNGTMYEYGTLSGPLSLTLPGGTDACVVGVVGSGTSTKYLDVILPSGDVERYRYSNFNAVYYRAQGASTFQVARQCATLLPPASIYGFSRLNTSSGYGSTNTYIRRITNAVSSQGSGFTVADTAALGTSITINEAGIYSISYTDEFNAAASMGLSLNSSQLTSNIAAITAANRLGMISTPGANATGQFTFVGYLNAGDVVRPHADTTPSGASTNRASLTIQQIAKG